MEDMDRWCVVEAPREMIGRLHLGRTVRGCLDWIRDRRSWPGPRLAVWRRASPSGSSGEPDVSILVPAQCFEGSEAWAEEVVDEWEARWLLIQSAPSRHRDEARADLVDAVAAALAAASATGPSTLPDRDETDVGF